jgi:hypothetical protein
MSKPTLISPNNFIQYGLNLERRILDRILYEVDNTDIHSSMITTVSFIAILVNSYHNRLLPLLRQVFLIPNRMNELTDLGP